MLHPAEVACKLIVVTFMSLEGFYEGPGKRLFYRLQNIAGAPALLHSASWPVHVI
jgi:hypothetical protein